MYEVFISYSKADLQRALETCRLLERSGLSCWIAPRNILPGGSWEASIVQAIENCNIMVLFFSSASNASEDVARELSLMSQAKKTIIPLRFEDIKLSVNVAYQLVRAQWVDASGPLEEAVTQLSQAIRLNMKEQKSVSTDEPAVQEMKDLLDIYDESMNLIAYSPREIAHKHGLWHKTFHCWFVSEKNGKQYVWVQKRSEKKTDFPGKLDISAARHLLHAETDRMGINKIDLELGVHVAFENVRFLGIRTYSEHQDNFFNREFNSVYLFNATGFENQVNVQPDEVDGLVKIEIDDGLSLFSLEKDVIEAEGVFYENGEMLIKNIAIHYSDFVPRNDNYYLKIFSTAKQFLSGSRYLSI